MDRATNIRSSSTEDGHGRRSTLPCSARRAKCLSSPEHAIQERARDSADDGTDDGNPGVAPIRRALAGDRQQRMREARAEIAGGDRSRSRSSRRAISRFRRR